MSPKVVILASLLSSSVTSLSLVGYKFTDNLLEKRFGPDNGYITFKVDRVPDQISACFRIYIDFRRFSYQGYMDFSKEGQPEPFTAITSKENLEPCSCFTCTTRASLQCGSTRNALELCHTRTSDVAVAAYGP